MNSKHVGLDLLRIIACFGVVFAHYAGQLGLGHADLGAFGVQIFFMISGYLIFYSAEKTTSIKFLINRFIRIYPLYAVSVGVIYIAAHVLTSNPPNMQTFLANFLFFHRFFGFESMDTVYWTLLLECFFYCYIAALNLPKLSDKYKYMWLPLFMVLYSLVTCLISNLDIELHKAVRKILIFSFAHYFFIGMLAYILIKKTLYKKWLISALVIIITISFFREMPAGCPQFSYGKFSSFIINLTIYSLFFVSLTINDFSNRKINKIIVDVAANTYAIYLIHNKCGIWLAEYFSKNYGLNLIIGFILAIIIIYIVSNILTKKVDVFCRSSLKKLIFK